MKINETSTHFTIPYLCGSWKVIATEEYQGKKIFLIKREQEGFLIESLVVDEDGKPVKKE